MLVFLQTKVILHWPHRFYKYEYFENTGNRIVSTPHSPFSSFCLLCRTSHAREIILRQFEDWSIIQQHLELLKEEELIITKKLDTLVNSI